MNVQQREALRDLLRRVDEVRGLGEEHARRPAPSIRAEALLETLRELVEELERSRRRLIETNVQLVSLREVASRLANSLDREETTRTVTRYLARAFAIDDVFLLLVNREAARLEGTWTYREGGSEHSEALVVPLLGDPGAIPRALWLDRTIVLHDPGHHRPVHLPEGHALEDRMSDLDGVVCVPLQTSQPVSGGTGGPHELCGARCIVGDLRALAPPPGAAAAQWAAQREERQARCIQCEFMPVLGVLGIARRRGGTGAGPADVALLESIALSVAPMVENARLYHDLRRSERFRNHVLDSMAGALVAVNMKGEILTFNRAAEALLGWAEAEVLGQPFGQLFGVDGEAVVHATLEHGREVQREEVLLAARDGTPVPVSLTTSLLRNERRGVYGAIATFVDLRPLKRAEEHARRLDRLAALGRFTSSVAHEIRNPLTGIAAGVQYMERALAADAPQRENLGFILSEIRRLDRIVQDLFDITHPRGLRLETIPLAETARRALQSLDALIAAKGIVLEADLSPRAPLVPHDPDAIQQVLINLIKNAVEASPPGATLRVAVLPAPAEPGPRGARRPSPGAIAQVEDHGAGIDPEDLKTIFEPFFTTKPGGTGLGLYISHDIVKRHGGSLTVLSEPGRGTTFTVELPLESHGGNP